MCGAVAGRSQSLEALQNRSARIAARTARSNRQWSFWNGPRSMEEHIRESVFKFVKKCVQSHTVPSLLKIILDAIIQSVCTLLDKATFYIRLLRGPRSQKDPSIWLNFFMEFRIYLTFTIFFYLYIVFNHDQYQCNVYMYIVDLYIVVLRLPLITDWFLHLKGVPRAV